MKLIREVNPQIKEVLKKVAKPIIQVRERSVEVILEQLVEEYPPFLAGCPFFFVRKLVGAQ